MHALGATIIRTPTEARWDAPEGHMQVAQRIVDGLGEGGVMLNQYENGENPAAHYEHTAMEIWEGCGGKVDVLVAGVGTGGTISGVARRLRELNPAIVVVGVDPLGSLLSDGAAGGPPSVAAPYLVEGIGYDFVPGVLDRSAITRWERVSDCDSFRMARRLLRREGLLCGGSSGSAVCGALQAIRALGLAKGARVVVILPDSVRNYMTKFVDDDWMLIRGFMEVSLAPPAAAGRHSKVPPFAVPAADRWGGAVCASIAEACPRMTLICGRQPCSDLVARLGGAAPPSAVVGVVEEGRLVGVVDVGALCRHLLRSEVPTEAAVARHMSQEMAVVAGDAPLWRVARLVATAYPVVLCLGALDGGVCDYRLVVAPALLLARPIAEI